MVTLTLCFALLSFSLEIDFSSRVCTLVYMFRGNRGRGRPARHDSPISEANYRYRRKRREVRSDTPSPRAVAPVVRPNSISLHVASAVARGLPCPSGVASRSDALTWARRRRLMATPLIQWQCLQYNTTAEVVKSRRAERCLSKRTRSRLVLHPAICTPTRHVYRPSLPYRTTLTPSVTPLPLCSGLRLY